MLTRTLHAAAIAAGMSVLFSVAEAQDTPRPATQVAAEYILAKAEGGLKVKVTGGYVIFETATGEVLTADVISNALGVELSDQDMSAVLDLVSAGAGQGASCKTTETAGGSSCATGNLCSDLAACSFYGDLATADGEKRESYLAEKSQDGRTYENFDLPAFEARAVSGETVSSASLKGKPTLLALLAPHCGHSVRSLSTLKRIHRRYASKEVNVVAVFVNTSSRESAKSRADQYKITYPLLTYADDDLGDVFESHLTPTILFVDAKGKVREKSVGEKTERQLTERLDALLADGNVELGMAR